VVLLLLSLSGRAMCRVEVLEELLRSGANRMARDSGDKDGHAIAMEYQHPEIAQR
jgi:hypothetical protein